MANLNFDPEVGPCVGARKFKCETTEEIARSEQNLITQLRTSVLYNCVGCTPGFTAKIDHMLTDLIDGMIELCSIAPASMGNHDAGQHGLVHHNLLAAKIGVEELNRIFRTIKESDICAPVKDPPVRSPVNPEKVTLGSGLSPEMLNREPAPQAQPESQPKAQPQPETKPQPKAAAQSEVKPKAQPKKQVKPARKAQQQVSSQQTKPRPDSSQQLAPEVAAALQAPISPSPDPKDAA